LYLVEQHDPTKTIIGTLGAERPEQKQIAIFSTNARPYSIKIIASGDEELSGSSGQTPCTSSRIISPLYIQYERSKHDDQVTAIQQRIEETIHTDT